MRHENKDEKPSVHAEQAAHSEPGRGRAADTPTEIPKRGWKDILVRTKREMREDNLSIVGAGVAFFLLLGMVPGLAALVSIYGLVSDPAQIQAQFEWVKQMFPADALKLLEEQLKRIAEQDNVAGIGAVIGILISLWSGSKAVKALIEGLNIAYDEEESRGFIKLTSVALALTLAAVVGIVVALGLVAVLPAMLKWIGLDSMTENLLVILRWPLLVVLFLVGLGVFYRFAPNRDKPRWRWVTLGAVVATAIWIAGSALFSLYVSNFASYNKTYGSMGAVVILLMWLYLSAMAVLIGAEINAETEHQTAEDTTQGEPQPMGKRRAYVADTLGEAT